MKKKEILLALLTCVLGAFSLVNIFLLPTGWGTKLLMVFPLLCLMGFLFFNALEDSQTQMISRWRNKAFIMVSVVLYVIRFIYTSQGEWRVCFTTWLLALSICGLLLILPTDKFGLGDSLSCVGVIHCYIAMFGLSGLSLFVLTMMIASGTCLVNCLVKRDKKVAFLPHLLTGSLLAICLVLTVTHLWVI